MKILLVAGGWSSERVVSLSGAAQIRMPGWLGRLERAYRGRGGQCVASPTLLFEDNSVNPFAIHLVPEMSDRAIPPDDFGRTARFTIWTERGCALDLPGKIRAADALPCLKEWSTGSAA